MKIKKMNGSNFEIYTRKIRYLQKCDICAISRRETQLLFKIIEFPFFFLFNLEINKQKKLNY